jgi:uncharacterized damage-inducible protein DinB
MPLAYAHVAIPDSAIPTASDPHMQHVLDTYASETNKVATVWRQFSDDDLGFRPHPRSTTVGEIFQHQLLSERRFFGEFLAAPEPAPNAVLPATFTAQAAANRLVELALPRLAFLARQESAWWLEVRPFFDVQRSRAWIFWRRVLHTAHHRTQLTVYLRMMDRAVPATYGPTADVKFEGADATYSVEAAGRK